MSGEPEVSVLEWHRHPDGGVSITIRIPHELLTVSKLSSMINGCQLCVWAVVRKWATGKKGAGDGKANEEAEG
jgi:hypothetical protein